MRGWVLAVLLAGCVLAAGPDTCQVAVLRNGFTLRYARLEPAGAATRVWLCAEAGGGFVEMSGLEIDRVLPPEPPEPLAGAPPSAAPSPGKPAASVREMVAGAAWRYGIDPDFVASVVKAESGFRPAAVSPKGAQGLMQLMPGTAAGLGVANAFDPAENLDGGTKYLRQLLDQYGGDAVKALAAYNAGPGRVEQYGGLPPYRETRAYVTRVIEEFNRAKTAAQ